MKKPCYLIEASAIHAYSAQNTTCAAKKWAFYNFVFNGIK